MVVENPETMIVPIRHLKTRATGGRRRASLRPRSGRNHREEATLIRACMEYLTLRGFLVLRNNAGLIVLREKDRTRAVRMGMKGASDIIACSPGGRFVAIECKSRKGKLTETQREFLDKVRKTGGIALVVRSVDELISFFKENNI